MSSIHYDKLDEDSLIRLAAQFSACLPPPLMLTFKGQLGAGKTTFIRAMLRALGIQGAIKSPTFSLVESYTINPEPSAQLCSQQLGFRQGASIHHFDLYRIQDERELDYLGFRDFFTEESICCIEWPERSIFCSEQADIECALTVQGAKRIVDLNAFTALGEKVLLCLAAQK